MSQTSFSASAASGFAGMIADTVPNAIISRKVYEDMALGKGVVQYYQDNQGARLPKLTQATILDDAGTFTAGAIVTTINGTAVSTTFGTDKNTTMTAHAAAIQASGIASIYSAVYTAGSHTIVIKSRDNALTVSVDVSGITGTMTITSVTYTSLDVAANLLGVTVSDGVIEQTSAGVVQYDSGETGAVLRRGTVWVYPEETVTPHSDVYFRVITNGAKTAGMFGASSDSSKCVQLTNARWMTGGGTSTLAKLELNLQ